MERTEVTKNQIINELIHIGHGDYSIYLNTGLKAVKTEPELFAHLIAWNYKKGQVRDSKAAFPVIALRGKEDRELYENAVAHLMLLDPRNLVKAVQFHKSMSYDGTVTTSDKRYKDGVRKKHVIGNMAKGGSGTMLKHAVEKYIRVREANRGWWNKTALQHRKSLKALYALFHVKPAKFAQELLFEGKAHPGTVFDAVKQLRNMTPIEAAGTILNFKIPFLVAKDAVPGLANKPDITLALIERMSGNELITNTNMLKKLGVFTSPSLKAAYDIAMERARKDDKVSTLKATRAATVVTDKTAKVKLKKIQDEQLDKLGGIEGDWLVLADKSGSMSFAIDMARQVSSLIAQQVKGTITLVFFDTSARSFNVSNKDFDEITDMTKRVFADGGTSIGVGLDYILQKGILVNGIAICSDGGENTAPIFTTVYRKYAVKFGIEPTIYFYRVPGDPDRLSRTCRDGQILLETFDIKNQTDLYSLPNLVKTMRTSRYTLIEEIMDTPLLTLKEVFKNKRSA